MRKARLKSRSRLKRRFLRRRIRAMMRQCDRAIARDRDQHNAATRRVQMRQLWEEVLRQAL